MARLGNPTHVEHCLCTAAFPPVKLAAFLPLVERGKEMAPKAKSKTSKGSPLKKGIIKQPLLKGTGQGSATKAMKVSEKKMLELHGEDDFWAHMESGRIIYRADPLTPNVWNYQDTGDFEKKTM